MNALGAADILQIWESGRKKHPLVQALLILSAAAPDQADLLSSLPLGRRNARLMAVRVATLGERAACRVACPACGEALEFSLDLPLLLQTEAGPLESLLDWEGYRLNYRMPTSRDLSAAAQSADPDEARRILLGRCLLQALSNGQTVAPGQLPERAIQALGNAILENDPLTDLHLELECAACGSQWRSGLDIASFFWSELEAQARRLLSDVHILARAYGWSEADILALSPARRQAYLELAS